MSTIDSPIFVVDDDASVREALGSLIRSAGLRVESFASAHEFLARPRAEGPSCLVLDVQLPGLSGLDLQQELAKAEVQLPIIFLTGHGDIPMSVRAIKAGALEFLTKPVDDEALLEAIQRGIAQDQRARQQQTNGASHSGEERNGTSAAGRAVRKQGEGVGAASANSWPSTLSPDQAIFRREGEYWTLGYAGAIFRLKDRQGLAYLAQLLRAPGRDFHALDLARGCATGSEAGGDAGATILPNSEDRENAGMHVGNLGDAGEWLDDQAKATYRRRLAELREELEAAKSLGRIEQAEEAEQEIEALVAELARATGLGGRDRRAASAAERARQSVTRSIKSAVSHIAAHQPALGQLLARCIKTGTYCCYTPDPHLTIAWDFEARRGEPASAAPQDSASDPQPTPSPILATVSARVGAGLAALPQTAFVGRRQETTLLRSLVDRARNGQGTVVLLGGGPGVGKTRLAAEVAEYAARQGFRALIGHCYEREEPCPYLPFAEMIEAELARAPSPEVFRQWLGEAAAELAQLAPSLRRVFPDLPPPPQLPPQQARSVSLPKHGRVAATRGWGRPLVPHLRGSAVGGRGHAGPVPSSGHPCRAPPGRPAWDLSRPGCRQQSGVGPDPGRTHSQWPPSPEAAGPVRGGGGADAAPPEWAGAARAAGALHVRGHAGEPIFC